MKDTFREKVIDFLVKYVDTLSTVRIGELADILIDSLPDTEVWVECDDFTGFGLIKMDENYYPTMQADLEPITIKELLNK